VSPRYPDYAVCWPDGSPVDPGLRDLLLHGLGPELELQHAQFAWQADGSLAVTARLAIQPGGPGRPQIWEIVMWYPAADADALRPGATDSEREWFAMMFRTHVSEWWHTRAPGLVTAARHIR
jgi:hypothetical protein